MGPDSGRSACALAATATGAAALVSGDPGSPAVAVLAAAIPASSGLRSILVWIAAGAGIVGTVGWFVGIVLLPSVSPTLLFGAGLAIGGGLGGGIGLLTGETDTTDESVTVDMAEEERPDPQPADLFEASPDPILYYDDTGDGPVVRAVNPAFKHTFGVSVDVVTGTAVSDALMTVDDDARLLEAISDGDPIGETLTCETDDGSERFRIRVAAIPTTTGTRGYVLYTPA